MLFRLNFFLCCVVLASCSLKIILSDEENTGWSTDYEYNSKSLPSIEVKLSPPENVKKKKKYITKPNTKRVEVTITITAITIVTLKRNEGKTIRIKKE
ncbi:hypothetical protein PMLGA01_130010000 [Plasmodium malariae]|uniref:Lipoprotein n=1 Tax=Plasmodium malariae TaxID=5858 RepID=A0A1C3KEI5_PLAMA|nr:hypothetical protein PMLGA01_130010000 [Plasmodium malariae]